jgi:predicted protein tyrosine phosphatase
MTHPQLAIFGYSEAAMFLRRTPPPNVVAIISIHGGREFGVDADLPHRLDLTFDDVEVGPADDVIAMQRATSRKRWAQHNGLTEVAPTTADAAAIVDFAEAVRGIDGIVLCHCGAGISRAPAAALICLSVWRGPGTEAECVAEVLRLRPAAVPHVGLVRSADERLGRQNRLVSVLMAARAQPPAL